MYQNYCKCKGKTKNCRYLPRAKIFTVFSKIEELLDNGQIGELVSVDLRECGGYYHYASSHIRGNWRNEQLSSPMILAKSSYDMDILSWLIGKKCSKLSYFGSLLHFKAQNMPQGRERRKGEWMTICSEFCV